MNDDEPFLNKHESILNKEQSYFVDDLLSKADNCNHKTLEHSNCDLCADGHYCSCRIDDIKLLVVGARLLPNIVNYLLNIIPQFLYPYVVAYLQDLSSMSDDEVTINDIYEYIISKKSE